MDIEVEMASGKTSKKSEITEESKTQCIYIYIYTPNGVYTWESLILI